MDYDQSVRLVVPYYDTMLQTVAELVAHMARTLRTRRLRILDIGSGTGAESLAILDNFPDSQIVAVDLSPHMHAAFRHRYRGVYGTLNGFETRVTQVIGDISGRECSPRQLLNTKGTGGRRFHIVVSSLTLHNLEHPQQALSIRRASEVLVPGGAFINADLFSYRAKSIALCAHQMDLGFIKTQHSRAIVKAEGSSAQRLQAGRNWWLRHYRHDNRLMPLEGTKPIGHLGLLARAGFSEVAVPFRYWQVAVVWARKARTKNA